MSTLEWSDDHRRGHRPEIRRVIDALRAIRGTRCQGCATREAVRIVTTCGMVARLCASCSPSTLAARDEQRRRRHELAVVR